jgi:hypothetical protein
VALSQKELVELKKLVRRAQQLIEKATKTNGVRSTVSRSSKSASAKSSARRTRPSRVRRSGDALVAFREKLLAEREAGVPVAKIAKKHRVSLAYVYQLGNRLA